MPTTGDASSRVASLSMEERDAIRAHLDAVLAAPSFSSSLRRGRLLTYLCTRALAGEGERVNEYAIGVDVFDKPASFDPRIDSIVRTEISQPPATRHERTGRLATVWLAAAALAVIGGACFVLWRSRGKADYPVQDATIAILPFLNLTVDSSKEYLGDSIADELTETLAESKDLRVVARTSAFQFKGRNADVRQIGRDLNAAALLEGSVGQQAGQYRIVVQLIRAADGYHLWSGTYDASPGQVVGMEARIARSIVQKLCLGANNVEAPVPGAEPGSSPEAHDLYMRARYLFQSRTPESVKESLALAHQAVKLDLTYARAYFMIAVAEGTLAQLNITPPRVAVEHMKSALHSALALNPAYSDARAEMAFLTYVNDWDWPAAEKEFQLALASEGSHGQAHNLYGWSLMTRKRFAEARNHLQLAEDLDPQSPGSRANQAVDWILEGKFPQARREIDGIFQLNPKSLMALRLRHWIAILQGDCTAARSAKRQADEWYPKLADKTWPALLNAYCGDPQQARRQLADLAANAGTEFSSPYQIAEAYAGLHDADHAIEYLQKSAEQRESTFLYLEIDSLLDPLRADPRFIALERRAGLPAGP